MRDFLNKVFTILWKDILSQTRTKDIASSVLVFALLVVVIFNFAFELESEAANIAIPGVLWVAFTFAGVLSLNRSFASEKDKGCLEGLMLCPVDREVIFLGKMLGSLTFMLIVEFIILPVFSIFFDLPLFMPKLIFIVFLVTLGFVSVGTLFSALAANTKARDIMLPILFFPVTAPLIIAAVKATGIILEGGLWSEFSSWLGIILAFDVIFLVTSALVFEFVIEE